MNENLESLWFLTVEIFVFILACVFAVQGLTSQEHTLQTYYRTSQLEDHRVFTSLQVNEGETYTGAEVLQSIYNINSLNADISVDYKFFYRYLDIETTDVSHIDLKRVYKVSYIRDQYGVLQTIVFS